jgi:hypothetical protein
MRSILLAATVLGVVASASASAQTFSFTTLDNPGDPTFNQLLGINDKGTIVGYFGSGAPGHPNIGYEIAAPYTAFMRNMQPGSIQTQATGINNADITTGFWSPTNLGPNGQNMPQDANFGFVRQPTGKNFTYISVTDPLTAGLPQADQALGINNSNVVAGFYNDANGASHAFTYALSTATYTPLKFGGTVAAAATGINDNGQVCGFYTTAKGSTFGFVRNATGGVVSHFKVPGTNFTQLFGINNAGVAVGFYMGSDNVPHGLYYTPATGAWTPVNDPNGVQGTVVNGINNKNQLVGFYTDAAGNTHGMIVTVTP